MSVVKIYEQRLFKFAKHLEKFKFHPMSGYFQIININVEYGPIRFEAKIKVHTWLYEEIMECFPKEWGYRPESLEPCWEIYPDHGSFQCAMLFFGIPDIIVFSHFFDLNGFQQNHNWGGEPLSEDSFGPSISRNILDYLALKYTNCNS